MKNIIGFIFVIYSLTCLIKFSHIDAYYLKENPKIGNILTTIITYSGVDALYKKMVRMGMFGKEKKHEILEDEFIVLKKEIDEYNNNEYNL